MRNFKLLVFCICTLIVSQSCNNDDDDVQLSACDVTVVLDNSNYQTTESDFYSLESAEIEDDCLRVNISASGCDGSTWVLTLVDSEDIAGSMPPQRYLKLSLANNEACLAVFNKEQSFDIRPLRIDGINEVLLNIEDFPELLIYTY